MKKTDPSAAPTPKAKPGRPSTYSDAMAGRICEMLAEGTGLHVICTMPGMPAESTVYLWLSKNPEFSERYARARERAADRFASEVVAIADQADDTIRGVEHARLRIDARKWAAGKFAPKKYSEKIMQEITGKDGAALEVKTTTADALKNLTDEQLAQLEALAIAATAGS